ncbi:MAG: hypothetical protein AAF560_21740 [Acidobacteriota bacterium]
MSEWHYQRGRLIYRKLSTGVERGREDWGLTRNRDGSRTLRCLAMTDDSKFVRDVTYTVGPDARPVDVLIRLQVGDAWVGSGYFATADESLRIVTDGAANGRTQQQVAVPERFHVMTHAVMLDGWTFWAYDAGAGGEQTLTVYNTSTRWDGTDGPLGRLEPLRVTLIGEEEIAVPAGTFRARHFLIASDVLDVPPSELWVTGEDNLLVRYVWQQFDLEYVLASLAT